MVELLSEKYLNNRTDIESRLKYTILILNQLLIRVNNLKELFNGIDNLEGPYSRIYYIKSLKSIADLMKDDYFFCYLLLDYFSGGFPNYSILKFGIKQNVEVNKLRDLIRNLEVSNENQTMAFHSIPPGDAYREEIVSVSNFTLNRHSKLIYDFRSTSTLYYDVVLPFHDKNYDENKTDCTHRWELPGFYSLY